jgi:hypothetical protein
MSWLAAGLQLDSSAFDLRLLRGRRNVAFRFGERGEDAKLEMKGGNNLRVNMKLPNDRTCDYESTAVLIVE